MCCGSPHPTCRPLFIEITLFLRAPRNSTPVQHRERCSGAFNRVAASCAQSALREFRLRLLRGRFRTIPLPSSLVESSLPLQTITRSAGRVGGPVRDWSFSHCTVQDRTAQHKNSSVQTQLQRPARTAFRYEKVRWPGTSAEQMMNDGLTATTSTPTADIQARIQL